MTLIQKKYNALKGRLDEKSRRIWAGAEAKGYGWGGIYLVSQATKISRITIKKGINEIEDTSEENDRIRKKGGGRKKIFVVKTKGNLNSS